jgi:PAS domain-containing protein
MDDPAREALQGADLITHGLCEECESFVASNEPRSLREFVNLFSEPVLCVDDNAQVLTANDSACEVLGLDASGVGDLLCGQVVQCRWACSPGGCGTTEHCVACSIRDMIRAAFDSGATFTRRPAYVERETPDGAERRITLYLSSERRGDVLLLRVDGVGVSQETPSPRNPR